ncbi:FG-GAP-like repeat-containing protein [Spirosoma sp. SC4-14]|uniref:FG-GAP-like repeat-containing protein n=1 Tax=Spirosoma sp. SC4-14 TaxID=3128900 RepID=UPI0030D22D3D
MYYFLPRAWFACLGGLFALCWSILATTAQGQGFIPQQGGSNPFNGVTNQPPGASPTLADLDGDGDLDMTLANSDGTLQYYRNMGGSPPVYVKADCPIQPPSGASDKNLKFSFGDIDGDGDLDALTGNKDGLIIPYLNNGSKTNPLFAQKTNPLFAQTSSKPIRTLPRAARASSAQAQLEDIRYPEEGYSYVSLADFDKDGDLDLLIITGVAIHYWLNIGTATQADYQELTECDNPFYGITRSGNYSNPIVGDLDGDGDLDVALSGTPILYYRNIGTPQSPRFVQVIGDSNPFNDLNLGFGSQLELGDLDGDGDLDLIVGQYSGPVTYYQNVLQITQQPTPGNLVSCAGNTVSTSVQATGVQPITYQWYRYSQTTDVPVDGQTSPTLTLTNIQPEDAGVYYVLVSGGGGSLFSEAFNLIVQSATITQQPASSSTVTAGSDVMVPVSVGGPIYNYQWYQNGDPVADQTSATLSLTSVTSGQAGDYVLVATSSCNSVTTTTFSLTVQNPTNIYASKTVSGDFTPGGTVVYSIELSNYSEGTQYDNPGDEFTDTLPTSLSLVSATATSGEATADLGTNTVSWNGMIGYFVPSLTITITATINNNTDGQTVSNQGTVHYDGDNNGSNESTLLTDDPGTEGSQDPTVFTVNCAPTEFSLSNDGPLSCEKTSVLLTAYGAFSGSTYVFSAGATQSGGNTEETATVTTDGVYSVTATAPNGCTVSAQTTVTSSATLAAPTLTASALTTTNQPISVTASGCDGGTVNWQPQGGTGTANGSIYTFTQPGNYTLTATCSLSTCTSPASDPLELSIQTNGIGVTSVTTISCQLFDEAKGGYYVTFTPQFVGQTSAPISFSVVNEKLLTTDPPPYQLRLYTDNPVITLVATQAGNGEARYRYDWWASCQSGTTTNQPPTTSGIPNQDIVQGQAYRLDLTNYFSDPDGQSLLFSAQNLPTGLNLTGSVISGTPSATGVSPVSVTAVDPGGLSVNTSFQLTVNPESTAPGGFTIAGVSTVSCESLSATERRITFTPQYAGTSGSPISFSVAAEKSPTTDPGPYTLNLYTDNPTITLVAQQGEETATYLYNWLNECYVPGRQGATESATGLQVKVLGNPVEGKSAELEISGAAGQSVQVELVDQQGRVLLQSRIDKATQADRVSVPLGASKGALFIQVSTPTQRQQVKLLKP